MKQNIEEKIITTIKRIQDEDLSERQLNDLYSNVLKVMRPICIRCVNEAYTSNLEYDDLLQLADIGVFKAIKSYDRSKGNKFITYAYYKIKGEISTAVRKDKKRKYAHEVDVIVSSELVNKNINKSDPVHDVYEIENIYKKFTNEELALAYMKLTKKEREVIDKMYFKDMTIVEIANETGRTRQAVNSLHVSAIKKLRQLMGVTVEV